MEEIGSTHIIQIDIGSRPSLLRKLEYADTICSHPEETSDFGRRLVIISDGCDKVNLALLKIIKKHLVSLLADNIAGVPIVPDDTVDSVHEKRCLVLFYVLQRVGDRKNIQRHLNVVPCEKKVPRWTDRHPCICRL